MFFSLLYISNDFSDQKIDSIVGGGYTCKTVRFMTHLA